MLPTVILPGYLAPAKDYLDLQQQLNALGIETTIVPLQRKDWFVTLGGRPITPILEQLDHTVQQVLERTQAPQVNIVGHSAGGWISRIYMGAEPYCDQIWQAQPKIHTLVSLGTPHTSKEAWTQRNLNFVNDNYPGAFHPEVKYVCVAGKALYGQRSWRLGQWFTYSSYKVTCGEGECWGDGVTPVKSAHLSGALNLTIDQVWHSPHPTQAVPKNTDYLWYGSPAVIKQWSTYLA
ncbi:triacylglycerol lipase [Acaryochloris sp. CCMEE 5410]|uniref:esterase/lipase family protein n=1 Tax=Acaryochloris sp. CCMEE 5410 TaxID=310037 RepID=UPI00024845BC|nr:alpha/beta hydrolase [Acaryochloris sp. CCMEE 5410]KAI9132166.1 alpha/beta hydrolase [Acaryochloris sp. CCMEE 5410]